MQTDEKLDFSKRLMLALKRSHKPVDGAVELALQFNLRHPHDSITTQSAHKWLTGKSKPTTDKIETLASWLNVSAHWLRYGSPNDVKQKISSSARRVKAQAEKDGILNEMETKLIAQFRRLSTHQRHLIAELTEQLAAEQEIWPEQK
jgi:transcriptional regulator with XRE-family HTH domain